jgi:hypothetical protein
VENVYTQHTPALVETVELLLKGRLKDASYPLLDLPNDLLPSASSASNNNNNNNNNNQSGINNATLRPIELIVFVVGGTTYEEARAIALLNDRLASGQGFSGPGPQPQPGARVILGGTCVHNSKT